MLIFQTIEAPVVKFARSFGRKQKYGDQFSSTMLILIWPGIVGEIIGLSGAVQKEQYVDGIKQLKQLSQEYNCPFVAERTGCHKLPFFRLDHEYFILKKG